MKKPLNKGGATLQPDLCVVGTGPAGLSLAAAGALLGLSVVLVGEPSRAEERGLSAATLRAAADRAHALRTAFDLGIGRERAEPEIDWAGLHSHMRHVVARDAPMAALDRYRAMGVPHVIHETAHFADPATLLAGSTTIRARRFRPRAGRPAGYAGHSRIRNSAVSHRRLGPGSGSVAARPFDPRRRIGSGVACADLPASRFPRHGHRAGRAPPETGGSRDGCNRRPEPAPGGKSIFD